MPPKQTHKTAWVNGDRTVRHLHNHLVHYFHQTFQSLHHSVPAFWVLQQPLSELKFCHKFFSTSLLKLQTLQKQILIFKLIIVAKSIIIMLQKLPTLIILNFSQQKNGIPKKMMLFAENCISYWSSYNRKF